MREYEVVYIFDPALDEDAVNSKLEVYHERLGGEIVAVDHWGGRQLAYPIRKQNSGYYVVTQFSADPSALPEYERILKLDDALMRYLVVLNEGEPTSGMSILAEPSPASLRPRDDDDDDDDDDDEDGELEEDERDADSSPPEFSGGRARRRRVEGPRIELLNYKDVTTLSRFITEQGKLLPKRTSKVTAQFQRNLSKAVKRARYLALLPYVRDHEV